MEENEINYNLVMNIFCANENLYNRIDTFFETHEDVQNCFGEEVIVGYDHADKYTIPGDPNIKKIGYPRKCVICNKYFISGGALKTHFENSSCEVKHKQKAKQFRTK